MVITRIETIPISVPLKTPFRITGGLMETVDHVIVKLYTDEDIVGLGEGVAIPTYSDETQEDVRAVIDRYLARAVVGEDQREDGPMYSRA